MKIIEAKDYDNMSRKAANIISAQVILNPKSILGLATGSTPTGTYRQLIDWYKKGDIDFSEVTTFNLDEYCGLCPENPQSYRYYMQTNFFDHINIKPENTNVPNGMAKDIDAWCTAYDQKIHAFGGVDLQLLGLGVTGHIGFNEPSDSFEKGTHRMKLKEQTIQDNSRFFKSIDEVPKYAITMGIGTIMQAKNVLLLINGSKKADVLEKVLFGPVTPSIPGSILQMHPHVIVIADQEAMETVHKKHPDYKF